MAKYLPVTIETNNNKQKIEKKTPEQTMQILIQIHNNINFKFATVKYLYEHCRKCQTQCNSKDHPTTDVLPFPWRRWMFCNNIYISSILKVKIFCFVYICKCCVCLYQFDNTKSVKLSCKILKFKR